MPDETTYTFRLIDETGGKPSGGPGVPPVVGPGVNPRTSQREQAESLAGGAAEVIEGRQERSGRQVAKGKAAVVAPPGGDVRQAGAGIAGRLGLGGIVGALGPATAAVAVVAAGAVAVRAFDQRLKRRTDELAPFSPDIARTRAQIEVERTLANIRAAREFGPEFADVERARARIKLAGQDFGDVSQILALRGIRSLADRDNPVAGAALLLAALNPITGLVAAPVGAARVAGVLERLEKFLTKESNVSLNLFSWFEKQPYVLPAGWSDQGEAPDVEFSDIRQIVLPALNLP